VCRKYDAGFHIAAALALLVQRSILIVLCLNLQNHRSGEQIMVGGHSLARRADRDRTQFC